MIKQRNAANTPVIISFVKKILLIILILVLVLIGAGTFLYHHYTDYDIATALKQTNLQLPFQKTKTSSPLSRIHHVFVIVEENHDWSEIYKNADAPYINSTLLPHEAFAANYHNVPQNINALHPSEPNYILLEAGKIAFADHTFLSDNPPGAGNSSNSHDHLTYLLDQKKLTWKSYQEDISGTNCPISTENNYAPKHNPFVFFQDVSGNPPSENNEYCKQHIRPLTELQHDLETGNIASYTFITPNLQHDMHDGTIAQADSWLATIVPMIQQSKIFQKDGVLFITWDEGKENDENPNNPIGMIIASPFVKKNYGNTISYSHTSLVKTIEEIFGLSPLLGMVADPKTQDLSNFFIESK